MSAELPALVVFVDGECGLCAAVLAWALRRDRGARLRPVPAQSEEARALLEPRDAARALVELHAWSPQEGLLRGAEAVAALLLRLPRWRLAGTLLGTRAGLALARPIYRLVARRRRVFGAARCPLPRR